MQGTTPAVDDVSTSACRPCPTCGAPARPGTGACEACARDERLDYELFTRTEAIDAFESGWAAYLESRDGRLAEREARQARGSA